MGKTPGAKDKDTRTSASSSGQASAASGRQGSRKELAREEAVEHGKQKLGIGHNTPAPAFDPSKKAKPLSFRQQVQSMSVLGREILLVQ